MNSVKSPKFLNIVDLFDQFNKINKVGDYAKKYIPIVEGLIKAKEYDVVYNKEYTIIDEKIPPEKKTKTIKVHNSNIFHIDERLSLLIYILMRSIDIYNDNVHHNKLQKLDNLNRFLVGLDENSQTGFYYLDDEESKKKNLYNNIRKTLFSEIQKIKYMTITNIDNELIFNKKNGETKLNCAGQYSKNHPDTKELCNSHLNNPLITLSNSQVSNIIIEMKKNISADRKRKVDDTSQYSSRTNRTKMGTGGGQKRKIYVGKRGGKYYITLKNGRNVKHYI